MQSRSVSIWPPYASWYPGVKNSSKPRRKPTIMESYVLPNMMQHLIFGVFLGVYVTIVSLDDGLSVSTPRLSNQGSKRKPIGWLCRMMCERSVLQCEIWKAIRIASSDFGCGYRIKKSAETLPCNEHSSHAIGEVHCVKGWHFRNYALSTCRFKLKPILRSYIQMSNLPGNVFISFNISSTILTVCSVSCGHNSITVQIRTRLY